MVDYPQWADVQRELDSPNVSDADKQRLLKSYASAAAFGGPYSGTMFAEHENQTNPDYVKNYYAVQAYAKQYGASDAFATVSRFNENFLLDKPEAGMAAVARQDLQNAQQRAQTDDQNAQAKTDLADEANRTVAKGGAGAGTSDEILDPGSRGMYFFQYFIPPYQDWTGSAPNLQSDIQAKYDELRGINFGKFRTDAGDLDTAHGKVSDITLDLNSSTDSLGGFWQGQAAQGAAAYCRTFMQHGRTVLDGLSTASQSISETMKGIESLVLQRAQTVLGLYADEIGGFTNGDVEQIIQAARGKASDALLRTMAGWQDVFQGIDWSDTDSHG